MYNWMCVYEPFSQIQSHMCVYMHEWVWSVPREISVLSTPLIHAFYWADSKLHDDAQGCRNLHTVVHM